MGRLAKPTYPDCSGAVNLYGDPPWTLLGGAVGGDTVPFTGEVTVCDSWGGGPTDRALGGGCGFILFCSVGRVSVTLGWCVGPDTVLDGTADCLPTEDESE